MIAVVIVIMIVTLIPDIPTGKGRVVRDPNLYGLSMEKEMRLFITWKRKKRKKNGRHKLDLGASISLSCRLQISISLLRPLGM